MKSALQRNVSGKVTARIAALDVPSQHRLRIARRTMGMNCTFANIMGGMNHRGAVNVIHELTGAIAGLPAGCTCK